MANEPTRTSLGMEMDTMDDIAPNPPTKEAKQGGVEEEPLQYSKEEYAKLKKELEVERSRRAGLDNRATTLGKKLSEVQAELERVNADRRKSEEDEIVRKVEDAGGDAKVVRKFLEDVRVFAQEKRQLEAEKLALIADKDVLAKAGAAKEASDLIDQYKLAVDEAERGKVMTQLLAAESSLAMKETALGLYAEKLKTNALPPTRVDQTSGHKPGTPLDKLPTRTALGILMEERSRQK